MAKIDPGNHFLVLQRLVRLGIDRENHYHFQISFAFADMHLMKKMMETESYYITTIGTTKPSLISEQCPMFSKTPLVIQGLRKANSGEDDPLRPVRLHAGRSVLTSDPTVQALEKLGSTMISLTKVGMPDDASVKISPSELHYVYQTRSPKEKAVKSI